MTATPETHSAHPTHTAPPFTSPHEHLDARLEGIWLLLQRFVARYGYRMFGSGSSFEEADRSFRQAMTQIQTLGLPEHVEPWHKGHWPSPDHIHQHLHIHTSILHQRLQATLDTNTTLPLEELRARFQLNDVELSLLIAVAAPQLSNDLARAYDTIRSTSSPSPITTCGFIAELIAPSPSTARRLLTTLDASSPLVQHGLLSLQPTPNTHDLYNTPITVPPSVLRFLCNTTPLQLPHELAIFAKLTHPNDAPKREHLIFPKTLRSSLVNTLRSSLLSSGGRGRIILHGHQGSGRRSILCAHLAEIGVGLLTADLDAIITEHPNPPQLLRLLCLEATLRRCALLLRCSESTTSAPITTRTAIHNTLSSFHHVLAFSTAHDPKPLLKLLPRATTLSLPPLNASQRRSLWTRTLQRTLPADTDPKTLAAELTRRVRATPSAMVQGTQRASIDPQWTSQPHTRADLIAHATRTLHAHSLGELADPLDTSLRWEDAILSRDTRDGLDELIIHATHQGQVFDQWGLGRKLPYGRGLSCLFYGPPGTGKTMTATLVAKRLGLPIYRVDLSKIVSKYIGETEKNLARLFEQASLSGAVLLFDEADSLFAKRTKVKDSNDRHANMKVNFLLQRMESYDGITILTTNLDKDLDEALRRRLRFRIHFPTPKPDIRAQLWSSILPNAETLHDDIDTHALGNKFEFSGGYIKNAVLRAAFQAAHQNTRITQDHLYQSALREARELGMLIRD